MAVIRCRNTSLTEVIGTNIHKTIVFTIYLIVFKVYQFIAMFVACFRETSDNLINLVFLFFRQTLKLQAAVEVWKVKLQKSADLRTS